MQNFIYPILAYILGSIPFGLILTSLFGKGDLRELGSGNIGTTNVVRTQGKTLGAMTFAFDFLKGFFALKIFHCNNEFASLALIAAPVIGHLFPVWLKFKGGKGVATYFGVLAGIHPYVFVATLLTWLAIFLIVRISAVAGLVSCAMSLAYFYYIESAFMLGSFEKFWVLLGLVMLIFIKHHKNISDLLMRE